MRKTMNKLSKFIFILLLLSLANVIYGSKITKEERLRAFHSSISEEAIGNYEKAIEIIRVIYKEKPNDYLVNIRLGWLYYLAKMNESSAKYYKEAVRISNNSIEALLGLTYPYSAMNNWSEIKSIYKKILDIDPKHYTSNLNLAKIYFNTADYLNSKTILEKLFTAYPSDYDVNLYLGWTYYYLGSKSNAYDHFATALIVNPNDASAKEGLNLSR